ncbi:lasso peptide biosynthesis B2 protein [Mesobacillus jeotgali]|uniref:lasso peptide biosynthesis B2 protein n=1 Tax=Mesobacillus jeotgali TaxID=129985 RepID=UPI001CFF228C|nr:lasso peptide biosynthesis B2 protein [Mesobacillus jeotgali]
MNLTGKIKAFLSLDYLMKLMMLEAYILLGWARIVKSQPFTKVVPILGESMGETVDTIEDSNVEILRRVSFSVNLISKYTFWESMCLVKAIAASKMLEKRGIESTLYLGTTKDETGKMIAHAWLRSGPYYITGAEGMEKFTVVGRYAKNVRGTTKKPLTESSNLN